MKKFVIVAAFCWALPLLPVAEVSPDQDGENDTGAGLFRLVLTEVEFAADGTVVACDKSNAKASTAVPPRGNGAASRPNGQGRRDLFEDFDELLDEMDACFGLFGWPESQP